jgi:imidazolonepropionase-like amidohydrolase
MQKIVLKGGVFNGFEYIDDASVVVDPETGLIVDAGPKNSVDEPNDAKVVKANTIVPGLIDAHVHFFGAKKYDLTTWVTTPEPLVALRSTLDLRRLLYAGFTSVRDMGSKGGAFLSRAVREGVIDGPRVLTCAKSLGQTGGDDDPTNLPLHIAKELAYSYFCDGPWECRRAVRLVLRDGADFVKIYCATGTTPEPYTDETYTVRPQFTVEEIRAVVDEAHRAGIRVAAHTIGEESVRNAVEAGVDSLEHGMGLTAKVAEQIKKKNIYYVPTLSVFFSTPELLAYVNQTDAPDKAFVRRHLTSDMKLAKEYGLKVVCGSDFGGTQQAEHGENYKEIVNLAKFLGNKEALVSSTSRAAECLGIPDSGQIKKGFRADMVALNDNPLRNIDALKPSKVLCVLKGGKLYQGSTT